MAFNHTFVLVAAVAGEYTANHESLSGENVGERFREVGCCNFHLHSGRGKTRHHCAVLFVGEEVGYGSCNTRAYVLNGLKLLNGHFLQARYGACGTCTFLAVVSPT